MPQQYNDGLKETETVSLLDVSEHGATIKVKDTSYELRQLSLDDYSRVAQYIRQRRIDVVEGMAITEERKDGIIERILSRTVTMMDIWQDFDGEMMMLARAFVGNPTVPEGGGLEFVKALPPTKRAVISRILYKICGLIHPLENATAATSETPSLPDLIPKTTPPSNGTESSEPFVGTTE